MLIVTKNDKQLYKFLKDVFSIMGRSSQSKYLLGQNGTLYFNTFYIKGNISIHRTVFRKGIPENQPMYDFGNTFYTLKMLDDKSFELKENPNQCKDDREHQELIEETVDYYKNKNWCCLIEDGSYSIISKVTRSADILIPDRYVGYIAKLGQCEVYVKGKKIICDKKERIEKENLDVNIQLFFVCDYVQEEEDNG